MDFDKTDIRLLAELQQNGRQTIVELADSVGLSHTPCARRLRQLEDAGAIEGYAAVLNPRVLGLKVVAFVQVKLERHVDENVATLSKALQDEMRRQATLMARALKVVGLMNTQFAIQGEGENAACTAACERTAPFLRQPGRAPPLRRGPPKGGRGFPPARAVAARRRGR